MIDALIACFVDDFRHKLAMNEYDDVDRTGGFEHISVGDGNVYYMYNLCTFYSVNLLNL